MRLSTAHLPFRRSTEGPPVDPLSRPPSDRERHSDGAFEIFKILGSTGNTYTVNITLRPSCDCPNGRKNGTCKHIVFVMLRVLHAPEHGLVWFQKSLLTKELAELFANAPPSPQQSALASGAVRASYRQALGKEPEADPFAGAKGSGGLPEKKKPEDGDGALRGDARTPHLAPKLTFAASHPPQTVPSATTTSRTTRASCASAWSPADAARVRPTPLGLPSLFMLTAAASFRPPSAALHKDCAQQWTQTKKSKGEEVRPVRLSVLCIPRPR